MSAATFAAPVVAWHGADDPATPLVVLLHGRGSSERDIIGLAATWRPGPACRPRPNRRGRWYAVRQPRDRPPGRRVLAETMAWFRTWLDEVAPAGRPVVLAGFSGGAAFAGGLVLDDPARFAGAAILYGTLPFDAGVPTDTGRLAGLPVFVAQGDQDQVIPSELLARTWSYPLTDSVRPTPGATPAGTGSRRRPSASSAPGSPSASLTSRGTVSRASAQPRAWRGRPSPAACSRSARARDPPSAGPSRSSRSPTTPGRPPGGDVRPDVGPPGSSRARRGSRSRAPAPYGPRRDRSGGGVPRPVGQGVAHLHPAHDGSLHLVLPVDLAADAVAKGWAQVHMSPGSGSPGLRAGLRPAHRGGGRRRGGHRRGQSPVALGG